LKEKADALMGATTSDELFLRMETHGHVHRVNKSVKPAMIKAAIVSKPELEEIKRVENIIRQGRVKRIDSDKVTLEQGTYRPVPDTLYIDCTATGYPYRPVVPIWKGRHITIQMVKFVQPTFSAALLAHVEATYNSEEKKNELCKPLPSMSKPTDWTTTLLVSMQNRLRWIEEPKITAWLEKSRLEAPVLGPPPRDPDEAAKHNASIPHQIKAMCDKLEEIVKNDTALAAAP
jgi:hypothetical protein